MTWKLLRRWIFAAIGVYTVAILVGIVIRYNYPDNEKQSNPVYGTYKDLIPFVIAVPAAWLAFCFQKRSSYVQQLRTLWTQLIEAAQDAISYTHLVKPTQEEYGAVLTKLFGVIDEIRGVYRNIYERASKSMSVRTKRSPEEIGLYPFEGVKEIRDFISSLGFGDKFCPKQAKLARTKIISLWIHVRDTLLREFDRSYPTYADSPYLIPAKRWMTARRLATVNPSTSYGKWVVLVKLLDLDYWWDKIRLATERGELGDVAKVYPATPSRSKYPGLKAIYVYVANPNDLAEVERIRNALRSMGVTWDIPYEARSSEFKDVSSPSPSEGVETKAVFEENVIRRLAYLKWECAGKPDGDGVRFWIEAEQELRRTSL